MTDALGTELASNLARAAWERHLGERPSPDLRATLGEGSIASATHATALRDPDRPALAIDGVGVTHGELDRRAARMAGWLHAQRLESGDSLLISSPSSVALIVAYLGALRIGASVVLANPAYTLSELEHVVRDSGPPLALAAGAGLERLRELRSIQAVVDIDALAPELRNATPLEPIPAMSGRTAILAYTSGTTGTPKRVPLTDSNLLTSIRAAMLAWRWGAGDVLVHSLPLFHQHGLSGVHATLLTGCRAVISSRFDPASLCGMIRSERASILLAVPSMYDRLMRWEGIAGAELGSLRLLISGSAPLSPSLAERVGEIAGQLPLERYGTTESGLDVSNPYDGPRRPGSVGIPLPGVELAIAGEDGSACDPGADGEIVLRGPQVFDGYRGDAAATAAAFHPGGWFRTGDIGCVDPEDGYVRITGRSKELIISGGLNVYPREVEFALEAHPAVARAAVVGIPSARWGEEVVAVVVSSPSERAVADELIAFARSRLAPYKCPKRILMVDELPLSALGKVVAADVRSLFAGSS